MDFLAALAEFGYLRYALLTALVVGALCGVVGSFITLRRLALMGDAISHAVLPGIAISVMFTFNLFLGALVAGLATALGIGFISQNSRIKSDAAIGIVFTAMFALGVVLISLAPTTTDLTRILFGNVLTVSPGDMWLTIGIGVAVVAGVIAYYKQLLITSFDPTMAAAYGVSTRAVHYVLMAMLTLVTVAALQTVGIILVVAMLVIPASTAYLLAERLSTMILIAAALGGGSAVVGFYLSYAHNLPSGAAIVLVAAAVFAVVFLVAPRHGLLWRGAVSRRAKLAAR